LKITEERELYQGETEGDQHCESLTLGCHSSRGPPPGKTEHLKGA
jgi:hypothetical protein